MHKEIRGLHQAAYILAFFTFGSQLLALVRDRLLAEEFGAHIELDLYYTAFRIPDALYVLFASTLSVYVLIPFLSRKMSEGGKESGQKFLSQFLSLFTAFYGVLALGAILCTPTLVAYFFPGFVAHVDTLVPLIQILLLQPFLLGISSLFGVVTQIEHRFILYALSPILYNVGIIVGLLVFYPVFGIEGLVYGVIVGATLHVLIQLPSVVTSGLMPTFTLGIEWGTIREVFRTSLTRALTLSLHQFVLLGFVGFASVMTVGSVSVFQFAYNLQSVPLAIIGVSYSVAAFPLLAQLYAEKKFELFSLNIVNALRHIFFWSLPIVALFVVIRAQFVRVVLGSGAFDWSDTRLTAAVLALFILSLVAQAVHLLLVRALYAVGNTRVPFFITLFSSFLALLLATIFHYLFSYSPTFYQGVAELMRLQGVLGIEVLSLPLGYSCALIVHMVLLFVYANANLGVSFRDVRRPFVESSIAALGTGIVAYLVLNLTAPFFRSDTVLSVFGHGLIAGLAGIVTYVGVQYVLKSRELGEVVDALKRRAGKREVIVPQDEDTLAV